jgi:hypothetical protein
MICFLRSHVFHFTAHLPLVTQPSISPIDHVTPLASLSSSTFHLFYRHIFSFRLQVFHFMSIDLVSIAFGKHFFSSGCRSSILHPCRPAIYVAQLPPSPSCPHYPTIHVTQPSTSPSHSLYPRPPRQPHLKWKSCLECEFCEYNTIEQRWQRDIFCVVTGCSDVKRQ